MKLAKKIIEAKSGGSVAWESAYKKINDIDNLAGQFAQDVNRLEASSQSKSTIRELRNKIGILTSLTDSLQIAVENIAEDEKDN